MFCELTGSEGDQLVPGTKLVDISLAPRSYSALVCEQQLENSRDSCSSSSPEIWSDIEDVIKLDNLDRPAKEPPRRASASDAAQTPTPSQKPPPLSLSTPDFSALINKEKLVSVDTPGTVPKSPGFHHIVSTTKNREPTASGEDSSTTPSSPVSLTTLRTLDSSLMETNMLINNTLTSGCEYQQYASAPSLPPVDISRSWNNCSPMELQKAFDQDFDTDNLLGNTGNLMEEMREKLKYTCTVLDIPMDPNTWNVEHVQRWVSYVMKQYDRVLEADLFLRLSINGASLTTMTKEEFVIHFPDVGEMLYNEMEIWCFAFSCGHAMTSPFPSNPIMPQTMQPEVTYMDLDSFKPHAYDHMLNPFLPPMSNTLPYQSSCHGSCHASAVPNNVAAMTMTSQVPVMVKQESASDLSPASSPVCAMAGRIPEYTLRTSSCGYASSEDRLEEHDIKRRVMASRGKQTIHLWQFLKDLLLQPECFEGYIRWLDRGKGIFKIENSAQVAKLWGRRKNRPAMNYDKLSRSIRQYYKKGIIKKTGQSKRLVYQFCPQYNG